VSAATTASSRLKQAGRARSPPKSAAAAAASSRAPSRSDDTARRRQQQPDAPINYAERRQHIHLKYARSIRENADAVRAQQRVAERRRKELEAKAAMAAAAAATTTAQLSVNPHLARVQALAAVGGGDDATNIADSPTLGEVPNLEASLAAKVGGTASARRKPSSLRPIEVDAGGDGDGDATPDATRPDDPALPGTFPLPSPDAPEPMSAVSTTSSGITQFDNEPQTEPPLQPPHVPPMPAPMYRYPFGEDDDDDDSDGISPGQSLGEPADALHDSMFVPGGFREPIETAFSRPHHGYETTGTITTRRRSSDVSPASPEQQALQMAPRPTSAMLTTPVSPMAPADLDALEATPRRPVLADAAPIHDEPASMDDDDEDDNDDEDEDEDDDDDDDDDSSHDGHHHQGHSYDGASSAAMGRSPIASPSKILPLDTIRRDPPLMERIALFRQSFASDMSEGTALEALRHALVQNATNNAAAGRSSISHPPRLDPRFDARAGGGLLTAPTTTTRLVDRASRQTAWTDVSVDSARHHHYTDLTRSYSVAPTPGGRRGRGFDDDDDDDASTDARRTNASSPRRSIDTRRSEDIRHAEDILAYGLPRIMPRGGSDRSPASLSNHRLSGSVFDSRRTSAALEFYESSMRGGGFVDEDMSIGRPSIDVSGGGIGGGGEDADPESKTSASMELSKEKSEAASKERHRLSQRRLVLKELIDTEAVFVRDMNIVEEIYKGTAEACPELDPQTIKLIFRNTDEIGVFHKAFLAQLKEAAANVYAPPPAAAAAAAAASTATKRPPSIRIDSAASASEAAAAVAAASSTAGSPAMPTEPDDALDRATALGPVFSANMERMKTVHEGFLRNSDHAAKRLIEIQKESRVHIWLKECNEVAKELTAAWNLDSLLIKPMQRITKYPTIMATLLQHTPADHPDREALVAAKDALETAIIEINKTKKNFELVGQIVGRKRKESDVKAGFARAFGKRVDKLQASGNRPPEDQTYRDLQERFNDDYLRLQVVLRDVEYYTRAVAEWVTSFMNYLSSIELVMRIQSGSFPELESKWVQFNVSMREIEKLALDRHVSRGGGGPRPQQRCRRLMSLC
jgi:hypothetical protein